MHPYDDASGVSSPPSRPAPAARTYPTDGDPASQQPPSIFPAWYLNMLENEVLAVLTAASIAPDKTNDGQLAAAIIALATGSAAVNNDNLLANGAFAVNQRARTSVADTQYDFDRWYALLQSGAVAPSQLTDPEPGAATAARYTQSQASAQRIGRAQVIESLACRFLRSKPVTFSGRARMSAAGNLRYALCEWTGSADAVTRDLVNDWANGTYTAGNFFVSSNVNVLGVGSLAVTANTWAAFTLTATCGAAMENLFVFVWTEAAQAQNVTLDFNSCKLEPGASATTFRPRAPAQELVLCKRYFRMSFPQGVTPAQAATIEGMFLQVQIVGSSQATNLFGTRFDDEMRAPPTIILFNPQAANAQMRDISTGTDWANTVASNVASNGFAITAVTPSGSSAGDGAGIHYTADAEL